MSVLFMEGFTGVPRGVTNSALASLPIKALGWQFSGLYNGSSTLGDTDSNHQVTIEADATFATRNRMSVKAGLVSAVTSYHQQFKMPLDTRGYEKFVIGMMMSLDTTTATTGTIQFVLAGPTIWPSTTTSIPAGEIFAGLVYQDSGADGAAYQFAGGVGASTPLIKKGKPTHLEAFIEQDVDRVRVYLDGVLVLDGTYTGTFASANGGFSFLIRTTATVVTTVTVKVSDMYVLGVDSLHTGPLGPAVRVLEVAPQSDMAVEFQRPASYASNAAVLQQMYNAASSDFLTAGDPGTDVYGGLDAVSANAAAVYGVAFKVNAMSLAEGTHTIAAAAKTGSTNWVGSTAYTLALGTLKPFVMDASKNPVTNARWSPSEIAAAGIGFRLVQ